MKVVLKVRKKGVIILPKMLRNAIGVNEGESLIAEVDGKRLILRALKPRVVDIDPTVVDDILKETDRMEEDRYERIVNRGQGRT